MTWPWLYQSLAADSLYWLVPTVLALIVQRPVKRVYKQLTDLWSQHIAAQQAQAQHMGVIANHLSNQKEGPAGADR